MGHKRCNFSHPSSLFINKLCWYWFSSTKPLPKLCNSPLLMHWSYVFLTLNHQIIHFEKLHLIMLYAKWHFIPASMCWCTLNVFWWINLWLHWPSQLVQIMAAIWACMLRTNTYDNNTTEWEHQYIYPCHKLICLFDLIHHDLELQIWGS